VELTLRPFITAGVAVTAAGVIAAAPVAPPPPAIHASAPRVSAQAVRLADAWSDLVTNTENDLTALGTLAAANPPNNPTDPVLQQFVTNLNTYRGELRNGQGGLIPGQVETHLTNLLKQGSAAVGAAVLSSVIFPVISTLQGIRDALGSYRTYGPRTLYEAPAVFLDDLLNFTASFLFPNPPSLLPQLVTIPFGLLTSGGPIGLALGVRNAIAGALYPAAPSAPAAVSAATTATPKTPTLNVKPPTGGSTPITANNILTKTGTKLTTTGTAGTTTGTTSKLVTQLNTTVKTVTTQLNAPGKKVSEVGEKR
jgi:hypothetical protein